MHKFSTIFGNNFVQWYFFYNLGLYKSNMVNSLLTSIFLVNSPFVKFVKHAIFIVPGLFAGELLNVDTLKELLVDFYGLYVKYC